MALCLFSIFRGPRPVSFALGLTGAVMPLALVSQIKSERVIVRPVGSADLNDLLEVNGDDEVTEFLPYATWKSIDDGSAWLTRMQSLSGSGAGQQLVIERVGDHKVIGTVLLFKYDESSSRLELGYVLGRAHWRQGFAKEALHAVCNHLFNEVSIRRVEAEVSPGNAASNALLRSLGFVQEGQLRKRWVAKGIAYDTNFYGCLAEEWQRAQSAA